METEFTDHHLTVHVHPDNRALFATVLQSGMLVTARSGETIGAFLRGLPGFTTQYIVEEIQTIFLNGTATDDLETPLTGKAPVLAVSAAMPGLAGAIFRKNSLHAALRTTTQTESVTQHNGHTVVTLKLFNAIARDHGAQLLQGGVRLKASNLATFFLSRASLLPLLQEISLDDRTVSADELLAALPALDNIHFTVVAT